MERSATLKVASADCCANLVQLLQRGTHAFLFGHREIEQDTGWQAFLDFRCSVSVSPWCMKVSKKYQKSRAVENCLHHASFKAQLSCNVLFLSQRSARCPVHCDL